jgi:hypothetical protein
LVKAFLAWDRIVDREHPDAYVQRVVVTTFLSWRRRQWWCEAVGKEPVGSAECPQGEFAPNEIDRATTRQVAVASLARLAAPATGSDRAALLRRRL